MSVTEMRLLRRVKLTFPEYLSLRNVGQWSVVAVLVLGALFGAGVLTGYRFGYQHAENVTTFLNSSVSVRDHRIIAVVVRRNPTATIRDFAEFPALLLSACAKHNLDFRYVMAVIDKESEWRPDAVSPAGAIGLMQVMPETAALVVKKLELQGYIPPSARNASGRYTSLGSLGDVEWNLRIGTAYLRWQLDSFGFGAQALRAYNRGPNRALEHWAQDTYAQDVSLRLLALVHEVQ